MSDEILNRLNHTSRICKERLKSGCKLNDLSILMRPKRTISINFPVKTSKGLIIFSGYRVQYNDALGPAKGGIRFHPEVNQEEVTSLAFWMTLKNSLIGLPYGGGKGGIVINPKDYSESDIEAISREYIRQFHPFLGPDIDIPAPDVYTNPKIMGWMLDEYEKIKGVHLPGMITGKPISVGGSYGRSYSTSLGGYHVMDAARKYFGISGNRVAIQGFGNAGLNMAEILVKKGMLVTAVSDSRGGSINPKGFDISALSKHKEKTGSVVGFPGSKKINGEDLLMQDCDILIPAALSNVINGKNASNVKAKMIVELANGPISQEADAILQTKKIIVIPDILANSGGVFVSYLEWIQNRTGDYWEEDVVLQRLEKHMRKVFDFLIANYVKKYSLSVRDAAYIDAITKIIQAEKDRGRI